MEFLPPLIALRSLSQEFTYQRIPVLSLCQPHTCTPPTPRALWVEELATLANKDQLPILKWDEMPNLQFPMADGSLTSLREVKQGEKLLLMDIWASWCAPCRLENRNVLVPLWEKYQDKGFQIIAYGLENSRQAWQNAIEKDGADRWLHASHLLGDQNPIMDSLRISTIPANFLLDTQGRVLAKNLHGSDLFQFVENYMARN